LQPAFRRLGQSTGNAFFRENFKDLGLRTAIGCSDTLAAVFA
jgi:hypothetical protein